MRVLVSAGEASGDLYAARVVEILKSRHPDAEFFGCAGPRMQAQGVDAVVDSRSLSVLGLVEVIRHIPRIRNEMQKLMRAAQDRRPDVALLTDSPGFHLRAAKGLKKLGIPVVHLIAPQAWAWREYRVKTLRATLARLLCIFPFEEKFFQDRGVPTSFIGHPLARLVKANLSRAEFLQNFSLPGDARILALVPGSRPGELARHMPIVLDAVRRICERHSLTPILALPAGFRAPDETFWEPIRAASIQCIEGHTWEVLAQADLALAKSGTVNIEAALLGTPMVTFYRVNALTFIVGRRFVKTPFFSIVNLIAGRKIVPELIQSDMTAERIAREGCSLLERPEVRKAMRDGLAEIAEKLRSERDPMEIAADWVEKIERNWRENPVTTA